MFPYLIVYIMDLACSTSRNYLSKYVIYIEKIASLLWLCERFKILITLYSTRLPAWETEMSLFTIWLTVYIPITKNVALFLGERQYSTSSSHEKPIKICHIEGGGAIEMQSPLASRKWRNNYIPTAVTIRTSGKSRCRYFRFVWMLN